MTSMIHKHKDEHVHKHSHAQSHLLLRLAIGHWTLDVANVNGEKKLN
jgi:hypothetical protein